MRCSQTVEHLSNKDLLIEMNIEHGDDTFVINEFAKKKWRIDLQINFDNSLFVGFIIFSSNQ